MLTRRDMKTLAVSADRRSDVEAKADALSGEAAEAVADVQHEPIPDVANDYAAGLESYIGAKHAQVVRIEERLEALLREQQGRVAGMQSKRPGILTPRTRRATWEREMARQRTTIQRISNRLDSVRVIAEGHDVWGGKLEQLAAAKFRRDHPELAEHWDELESARRAHETHAKLKRKQQTEGQSVSHGRGLSLRRDV